MGGKEGREERGGNHTPLVFSFHALHLPPLSGTPLLFLALCESREPSHKQKRLM